MLDLVILDLIKPKVKDLWLKLKLLKDMVNKDTLKLLKDILNKVMVNKDKLILPNMSLNTIVVMETDK